MRVQTKMYYSSGLEYIVRNYYLNNTYSKIGYFSRNIDGDYEFKSKEAIIFESSYTPNPISTIPIQYKNQNPYVTNYAMAHSFAPEIFLSPQRPKTKLIDNKNEIISIIEETFELMMKERLPNSISFNILTFDDFKVIHSKFGLWNNSILGFSINGKIKKIFVRENHLDTLMLVIGHEIGHVITEALSNNHDEEAKAFAFSIEWAKTIKKHNIGNLALSIKDEIGFNPAKNGLHDIAFAFVDLMVKKGRKAMSLHNDLVKRYISIFDRIY